MNVLKFSTSISVELINMVEDLQFELELDPEPNVELTVHEMRCLLEIALDSNDKKLMRDTCNKMVFNNISINMHKIVLMARKNRQKVMLAIIYNSGLSDSAFPTMLTKYLQKKYKLVS